MLTNERSRAQVPWGGSPLDKVHSFSYLGRPFHDDIPREEVIPARLGLATAMSMTLSKHILHNKRLNAGLKLAAARPLIEGTLFFGCETWPCDIQTLDKVDRLTSQLCRRILKLNYDGGSWAGAIAELNLRIPSIESKRRMVLTIWRLFNDPRLAPTPLARLLKLVWNAAPSDPSWIRNSDSSWISRSLLWLRTSRLSALIKAPIGEIKMRFLGHVETALRNGSFLLGPQQQGKTVCANLVFQKRYFSSLRPIPKEIIMHHPAFALGTQSWCALRLGSLRFSGRWNWVFGNKTSDHTCCACRTSNEDTEHLLWHCKAWARPRRHLVDRLSGLLGQTKWDNLSDVAKSQLVLGGVSSPMGKLGIDCSVAATYFLNRVSRIRDIFVATWGNRLKDARTA